MAVKNENRRPLIDLLHEPASLVRECIAGLGQRPRTLPCKYLYDERGSKLFDRICELPEYYPPRIETAIMRSHVRQMLQCMGESTLLIELGSGSSTKTRILLDAADGLAGHMPLDISRDYLCSVCDELAAAYPELPIQPVCVDYTRPFSLPEPGFVYNRRVAYFPGSTIGNFHPEPAKAFLHRIAAMLGPGGGMLIGVDLRKSRRLLERAYNDRAGVTAAFNLNLLHRLNREAGATFNTNQFEHHAVWNEQAGRIEMHLVSRCQQQVQVDGIHFDFEKGETIRTECSYKYTLDGFAHLARDAFTVDALWTDPEAMFSMQWLIARE